MLNSTSNTEWVKFELRKGDVSWFFTMTSADTVQLECRFESLRTRLFTTDLADARARWAELVAVGFTVRSRS